MSTLLRTLGLLPPPPDPSTLPPKFPYNSQTNPYHTKKPWPPDFTQLSSKHQFRLERRYRRRTKLKWARPTWTKAMTLAQWGSICFVVFYGVVYLEVGEEHGKGTVFEGVRRWGGEQVLGSRGGRGGGGESVREQG